MTETPIVLGIDVIINFVYFILKSGNPKGYNNIFNFFGK